MELLLATSNEHKAKMLQAVLGRPVQHVNVDLPELQAIDVKAVIEHKARTAYALVGKPVLVEDTSLAIHAWHGLPGALIRWFLDSVGNAGICTMLTSYEDTAATAETWIGYFDGERFVAFSAAIEGEIARSPRGANGFGWDAIFVPTGWDKTLAEMTHQERDVFISMRKAAVLKLNAFLVECGL